MSENDFYPPVLQLERHELPQENSQPDDNEFIDVMGADMALGIAAQDHCKTRDELTAYTLRTFLTVLDETSVSRAAERLGVSQSTTQPASVVHSRDGPGSHQHNL